MALERFRLIPTPLAVALPWHQEHVQHEPGIPLQLASEFDEQVNVITGRTNYQPAAIATRLLEIQIAVLVRHEVAVYQMAELGGGGRVLVAGLQARQQAPLFRAHARAARRLVVHADGA
jgi:hypothetical protein